MSGNDQQLPPIVSAQWLADRLASPSERPIKVVDVRWYLDGRSGPDGYAAGHLPGAIFIDLDKVMAAPASPAEGRHPMPTPSVFAEGMAEIGIGDDDPVVAYDDLGGTTSGRLVWMLRILGLPAAMLDGGLQGWDGELETGAPTAHSGPRPQRRTVPWPPEAMADADAVVAHIEAGGVVVDSRAPERYRGDTEPVDPRAGHIPGAVNLLFMENLGSDGRFKSPKELIARFDAVGADESAIFYCGSGVSACHNILAMEATGRPRPRLYPGSWSQWSSDDSRPAATGESA